MEEHIPGRAPGAGPGPAEITIAGVAWRKIGGETCLVALGRGRGDLASAGDAPSPVSLTIVHEGRSYRFDGRATVAAPFSGSASRRTLKFVFRLPRRVQRWRMQQLTMRWQGGELELPLPAAPGPASAGPAVEYPSPQPSSPGQAEGEDRSGEARALAEMLQLRDDAQSLAEGLMTEAERYRSLIAEHEDTLRRLRDEIAQANEELAALRADAQHARELREEARNELDRARHDRDRTQHGLSSAAEELAQVERELSSRREELADVKRNLHRGLPPEDADGATAGRSAEDRLSAAPEPTHPPLAPQAPPPHAPSPAGQRRTSSPAQVQMTAALSEIRKQMERVQLAAESPSLEELEGMPIAPPAPAPPPPTPQVEIAAPAPGEEHPPESDYSVEIELPPRVPQPPDPSWSEVLDAALQEQELIAPAEQAPAAEDEGTYSEPDLDYEQSPSDVSLAAYPEAPPDPDHAAIPPSFVEQALHSPPEEPPPSRHWPVVGDHGAATQLPPHLMPEDAHSGAAMRFPAPAAHSPREKAGGYWFATALRELAEEDREAAGRVLVSLLPAQAIATPRFLSYDLVIRELGIYAVDVDGLGTQVEPRGRPRPLGQTQAWIMTTLPQLGELVARGRRRGLRRLRRDPVSVDGDRARVADLVELGQAPLRLSDLAEVGAQIEPSLLLRMVVASVDPQWTIGERFTIRIEPVDPPLDPCYVRVNDGSALTVTSQLPLDRPAATLRCSPRGLLCALAGVRAPEGEELTIAGSEAPIRLLATWVSMLDSAQR